MENLRETDNLKHIDKNKLDKPCFAHDTTYSNSKDLAERTVSDNIFKNRAYKIAINLKYDGYQRRLAIMAYYLSNKKTGSGTSVYEELAQELYKPVF